MNRPWTGKDYEQLIDNWKKLKPKEISKLLNRSVEAVNIKASELQLERWRSGRRKKQH